MSIFGKLTAGDHLLSARENLHLGTIPWDEFARLAGCENPVSIEERRHGKQFEKVASVSSGLLYDAQKAAETRITELEQKVTGCVSQADPRSKASCRQQIRLVRAVMRIPRILNAMFNREADMNEHTLTADEIRIACPWMPADAVADYASRGWQNIESVQRNWRGTLLKQRDQLRADIQRQQAKRAAAEGRADELQKELASHRPVRTNPANRVSALPGCEPLAWTPDRNESDSLMGEWRALVEAKIAAGVQRIDAQAAVARENPTLRSQLVAEFNRR